MHTVFIVAAMMVTLIGCTTANEWIVRQGQHSHHVEKEIIKTVGYDVLLYAPKSFTESEKRWPLIIFLHGSGERGSDPNKLKVHSLPNIVETKDNFPFLVISPQCPDGQRWNAEVLNAMLNEVLTKLPIDTNRIYLTGLSMGGLGTWKFAIAYPERFAAIAPVCGWGHLEDVEKLKEKPIWVFHGAKDNVVPPTESEKMVQFLQKFGNTKVKYTVYPEANHNAWDVTYANPELYEWFLQHSKTQLQ